MADNGGMKKIIFFAAILLSGCAGKSVSARSDYIGNDLIEIVASGGSVTESDDIRSELYKKAYESCVEKDLGFKMVEELKMIPHYVTTGWLIKQVHTEETYRVVIKCEGPVDSKLVSKYRLPASK